MKSLFFITFLKYYLAGFLVRISSFSHSVKPFRSFPLLLADNSPLCKDSPSHSQSVDFYPKYIVIYCLKTLFCWNLVEIHLGKLLCKEIIVIYIFWFFFILCLTIIFVSSTKGIIFQISHLLKQIHQSFPGKYFGPDVN